MTFTWLLETHWRQYFGRLKTGTLIWNSSEDCNNRCNEFVVFHSLQAKGKPVFTHRLRLYANTKLNISSKIQNRHKYLYVVVVVSSLFVLFLLLFLMFFCCCCCCCCCCFWVFLVAVYCFILVGLFCCCFVLVVFWGCWGCFVCLGVAFFRGGGLLCVDVCSFHSCFAFHFIIYLLTYLLLFVQRRAQCIFINGKYRSGKCMIVSNLIQILTDGDRSQTDCKPTD